MTLKRVSPGDPLQIEAKTFNAFVDMANARQGGFGAITTDQLHGVSLNTAVFPIKNNSGAAIERFGVLAITGPLFAPTAALNDEFRNHISFVGSTAGNDDAGKFAVLQAPCAAGKIARGVVVGVCVAKVDVLDASHGWADVKPGSTESLRSGQFGTAQILYKEAGIGVKLALVRLGVNDRQFYPAIVTASAAINDHSWTYTVKFAESSAAGLTGFTAKTGAAPLTAYNLFEKIDREAAGTLELDPRNTGTDSGTIQPIENDSIVMIAWIPTTDGAGGAWYFERANSILANCSDGGGS